MTEAARTDDLQLEPAACRTCGTTDGPLHPDGFSSTPVGDSILRRDSVVCTQHLVLPQ